MYVMEHTGMMQVMQSMYKHLGKVKEMKMHEEIKKLLQLFLMDSTV